MSMTRVEAYLNDKYPDPVQRARVARTVFEQAISDLSSRVQEINRMASTLNGYSRTLADIAVVCAEYCQSMTVDAQGAFDDGAYRELVRDWPALSTSLLSPSLAAGAS